MSLVSNLFLLFVAASVLVYYIVPHKFQWLVLLCFSYIYYLAGGVRYVGFLLFSTLVTWLIALAVEKTEAKGSHKGARNLLVLGLLLNFGMLGVVKYTNFAIENLKGNGDSASSWYFVLYFPVFRISSGCVLEEM